MVVPVARVVVATAEGDEEEEDEVDVAEDVFVVASVVDPVVDPLVHPVTVAARAAIVSIQRPGRRDLTGYRGRPSTRSPRMLRITLDVPPMIV